MRWAGSTAGRMQRWPARMSFAISTCARCRRMAVRGSGLRDAQLKSNQRFQILLDTHRLPGCGQQQGAHYSSSTPSFWRWQRRCRSVRPSLD